LSYLDAREGLIIEPTLAIFNDQGDLTQQFRGSTGVISVTGERTVHITIRQGTFTKWERVEGRLVEVMIANIGEQLISVQLEDPFARLPGVEDMAGLELVSEWSRSGGGWRNTCYTELHLRFAKALGPICLILLAIPIGIRVKKGTKLSGLGMALPPLLVYFILFFVGQSLAQRRLVAPEVGAYGPNGVVLAAALVLTWKVFRV